MADQASKANNSQDEVSTATDDQKIVIDGQELSVAEAKELIESGKSMKELKEQYPNVDFKEMPKAFTQAKQELAKLNKKEESGQTLTPDEQERRKQIDELFDDPYVAEKLDKRLEQKAEAREQKLKEDFALQKELESLEAEFDGKDGRPKFDRIAVLKYGQDNNLWNPRVAYKQLHEDALDEWKINQKLTKKRPTTHFERRPGGGERQPERKRVTTLKEAEEASLAVAEE